jgi:prepilin-type N-terminal cleavage/methylation domain-containing protein
MERKLVQPSQAPSIRRAFTLVELLVVITIIGILAALITAAGAGALKRARQARIKAEIDQIAMALQTYKDNAGAYPPNCQSDGPGTGNPLNEPQILTDVKRALKQAFPRHAESDELVAALVGLNSDGTLVASGLRGGMSAGESLVFWLGGFSSDPKYPISGEGGPSYLASLGNQDPIESRKWIFPFEVARLQPRNNDNYFDDSATAGARYIEYADPRTPNDPSMRRRINFWQYVPAQSEQPYVYFDTSRHDPQPGLDPPAAASPNPNALHVHAVKMRSDSTGAALPIQFANRGKFQILHCGIDDEWDDVDSDNELTHFEKKMSYHGVEEAMVDDPDLAESYLLFPDGPFTGEVADTLTNFSEGTLEASQP